MTEHDAWPLALGKDIHALVEPLRSRNKHDRARTVVNLFAAFACPSQVTEMITMLRAVGRRSLTYAPNYMLPFRRAAWLGGRGSFLGMPEIWERLAHAREFPQELGGPNTWPTKGIRYQTGAWTRQTAFAYVKEGLGNLLHATYEHLRPEERPPLPKLDFPDAPDLPKTIRQHPARDMIIDPETAARIIRAPIGVVANVDEETSLMLRLVIEATSYRPGCIRELLGRHLDRYHVGGNVFQITPPPGTTTKPNFPMVIGQDLGAKLAAYLRKIADPYPPDWPIFRDLNGRPVTSKQVQTIMDAAGRACGVEGMTATQARRNCISLANLMGMPHEEGGLVMGRRSDLTNWDYTGRGGSKPLYQAFCRAYGLPAIAEPPCRERCGSTEDVAPDFLCWRCGPNRTDTVDLEALRTKLIVDLAQQILADLPIELTREQPSLEGT